MDNEEHGSRPIPDPTILTTGAIDRAGIQIRNEIAALKELLGSRIDALAKAVDVQKETSDTAINKSDAATGDALKQQGTLLHTTTKGLDDKINDLKDRVTGIESEKRGGKEEVTARQSSIGLNNNILAGLVCIGGVLVAIVALFLHAAAPAPVTYVSPVAPLTAPITK